MISVVTPLFHGMQYVERIIHNIETAARECTESVELIFVNDDPGESFLQEYSSDHISIKLIESESNVGIHGARVKGLLACTGVYILFLDQDDSIDSSYFASQMTALGDADAVVCMLMNGGVPFYKGEEDFVMTATKGKMLEAGNQIVSPGQVLIRKDAISPIWINHILENNGADDWMLWLLFFLEDRVMNHNPQVLFYRSMHEQNASERSDILVRSEWEVYELLHMAGMLKEKEERSVLHALQASEIEKCQKRDDMIRRERMYQIWIDSLTGSYKHAC